MRICRPVIHVCEGKGYAVLSVCVPGHARIGYCGSTGLCCPTLVCCCSTGLLLGSRVLPARARMRGGRRAGFLRILRWKAVLNAGEREGTVENLSDLGVIVYIGFWAAFFVGAVVVFIVSMLNP
jgi:hypothetical protein